MELCRLFGKYIMHDVIRLAGKGYTSDVLKRITHASLFISNYIEARERNYVDYYYYYYSVSGHIM